MINQARTLLLNIEDQGVRSEYIPSGFKPLIFKAPLATFHSLIMPDGLSRFNKEFLVHNYLKLVDAAGLSDSLTVIDKRLTYGLDDKTDYFQFNRISNVLMTIPAVLKPSDSKIITSVSGKYDSNVQFDAYTEEIIIKQLTDNTGAGLTSVTVYSADPDGNPIKYYVQSASLNFSNTYGSNTGMSRLVSISSTGLVFQIFSPDNFLQSDSNHSIPKGWKFIVEHPLVFKLTDVLDRLDNNTPIVDAMLSMPPVIDSTYYDNLWRMHNNKVYRLVGLLIAFTLRASNKLNIQ